MYKGSPVFPSSENVISIRDPGYCLGLLLIISWGYTSISTAVELAARHAWAGMRHRFIVQKLEGKSVLGDPSWQKRQYRTNFKFGSMLERGIVITDAQIQMARELGMNPKKFGGLANHRQEKWKLPLAQFIEHLYFKGFGKTKPDRVILIEERTREIKRRELSYYDFLGFLGQDLGSSEKNKEDSIDPSPFS